MAIKQMSDTTYSYACALPATEAHWHTVVFKACTVVVRCARSDEPVGRTERVSSCYRS